MHTIKISGMSCGHCSGSVTKLLESMPGVSAVNVTLNPGQANFEAAPDVDLKAIKDAIRKIGFEPDGL